MPDDAITQASERSQKRFHNGLKTLFGSRTASAVAWSVFIVGIGFFLLRAGMMMTPFFEARANAWLDDNAFNARLTGLQGAWHGMTPTLRVKRIEVEQGVIEDLVVELDLARSLLALAPRINALQIGGADITFAEDFDLIERLANASGRMRLTSILGSAEYLSGNLSVRVGAQEEAMLVQWILYSGTEHRGRVWLRAKTDDPEGNDTSEALVFGFDLDRGPSLTQVEGALWAKGALRIPDAFASLTGLAGTISALDARVRVSKQQVTASVNVDAEQLRVGDYLIDAVDMFARGAGTPRLITGEFQQAHLRRGQHSLDFSGTKLAFEDMKDLSLQVSDQDMQNLTQFAALSAMRETLVVRWLTRFQPAGRLERTSLHARAGSPLTLVTNLEDFSCVSWMGSPALRNVSARAVYAHSAARMLIDSKDAGIELARLFAEEIMLAEATGEVWVRFLPNYVGVQGRDLRATLNQGGEVLVNASYSAPVDPAERQISGSAHAFALKPADALQFVPKNLPAGMRAWLHNGIQSGEIEQGEIVLSGYVRRQPPVPTMQVEMWLDWRDGELLYHPRWPLARSVSARVALQGGIMSGQLERARLLGMQVEDMTVEMPLGATSVHLRDAGQLPADGALRLLVDSPLGDMLPLARDQLEAGGLVEYELATKLPFKLNRDDFELDLRLRLQDLDVSIESANDASERFSLTELNGVIEYVFPNDLNSDGVDGTMFGQAVNAVFSSGPSSFGTGDRLQAEIRSRVSAEFLRPYLGSFAHIDGEMGFAAHVEMDAFGEAAPRVRLASDLAGMRINLPPGLGKNASETAPLLVDLELTHGLAAGKALFSLQKRIGGMLAWQAGSEGQEVSGAIVLGAEHSRMDVLGGLKPGVRIFGKLPSMTLDELRSWTSGTDAGSSLPDLHFEALTLDGVDLGSFSLGEVSMDGVLSADAVELAFQGESLVGSWMRAPEGVNQVSLARLHLASTDESGSAGVGGLLADIDLASLPKVDALIESLQLGDKDYGAWRFGLRQIEDGVRFVGLEAESRGLSIRATDDFIWRKLPDGAHDSRFVGELATDNLAEAMAGWGFAPSVEAERAVLIADLHWPDAPWKPKLAVIDGDIDLTIRRGRFRDFEAGAGMRLLTLLDFNAFLQRLTLDFSDAFGEGVAFDEVQVKSHFDTGTMHMVEPVKIDGNGGRFRIDGSINLVTGELDNQFEATLKISRSLPWLAGYMALLGNPVTGLSVVVGERILRDRLEDFSTARYSVTGTLSEPVFSLAEVEPPEPLPAEISPEGMSPEETPSEETLEQDTARQ